VAPARTNACVVIDGPLLQQRYGFLNFRELLQLMEKQNFATSIAFIPWNWRRSHRGTVSDFQPISKNFPSAYTDATTAAPSLPPGRPVC
jgi:hypothetical protein